MSINVRYTILMLVIINISFIACDKNPTNEELINEGKIVVVDMFYLFPDVMILSGYLTYKDKHLFISGGDYIYKIDTIGNILDSIYNFGYVTDGIAFEGDYFLFLGNYGNTIFKVNQACNNFFKFSGSCSINYLTYDGSYFWGTGRFDLKIYKFSNDGNIIDSFNGPSSFSSGLAFDGSHLWYALHDSLCKVDTTGNIITTIHAPDASCLVFDGALLWYADDYNNKMCKLDTSGNIIYSFNFPIDGSGDLAFDGKHLWYIKSPYPYTTLYKLSTTGEIIDSMIVPFTSGSCGGLTFDGTYLWCTDPITEDIIGFDTTGETFIDIKTVGNNEYLTFDGTYIWTYNEYDTSIIKLDFSGTVANTFKSPSTSVHGLAHDGNYLWVVATDVVMILYKLDDSGTLIKTYTSDFSANVLDLTSDGTNLWCLCSNYVYKINTK